MKKNKKNTPIPLNYAEQQKQQTLIQTLKKGYNEDEIEQKGSTYIKDYLVDVEKYKEQLMSSDGKAWEQIKEINSSAALAVNYHIMLNPQKLCFEKKVAVPLKKSSKEANLDVKYKDGEETVYVESKFLEPFYSRNEDVNISYLEQKRYPNMSEEEKNKWKELIIDSQNYCFYNFTQLCRHLMALYRCQHEGSDKMTKIKLIALSWIPSDSFFESMKTIYPQRVSFFRKRLEIILQEKEEADKQIRNFLKEIGWESMTFETKTYNDKDVIKKIEGHPQFAEFKKRYFLD